MKTVSGYPCRMASFLTLKEFQKSGGKIKDLILPYEGNLSRQDSQLAKQICYTVIRHRNIIQFNYASFLTRPSLSLKMKLIFEIACAQYFFMDKIPPYAIINTSVEMAKKLMGKSMGNLANAVLNKVIHSRLQQPKPDSPYNLSLLHSFPEWYILELRKIFPIAKIHAMLEASNQEPKNWVWVNLKSGNYAECLKEFKLSQLPREDYPYTQILDSRENIIHSSAFEKGVINIQDPGAWHITSLVDLKEDEYFLDYCGAPGGKTALVAKRFPNSKNLFCGDSSCKRLLKIWDLKNRQKIKKVFPMVMDGTKPALKHAFQKILVDAPCSNSGVISRRPEAKWRLNKENLETLAQLQLELLTKAYGLLAPSGALVYSTCSPYPEETTKVMERFFRLHPHSMLDNAERFIPKKLIKNKCLHVYPGEWEGDGYFAARIIKPQHEN